MATHHGECTPSLLSRSDAAQMLCFRCRSIAAATALRGWRAAVRRSLCSQAPVVQRVAPISTGNARASARMASSGSIQQHEEVMAVQDSWLQPFAALLVSEPAVHSAATLEGQFKNLGRKLYPEYDL